MNTREKQDAKLQFAAKVLEFLKDWLTAQPKRTDATDDCIVSVFADIIHFSKDVDEKTIFSLCDKWMQSHENYDELIGVARW